MPLISSLIVEVCVFRFENNTVQYLLLHRAKGEQVYPNIWQLVSGAIERGEKAVDAALRELEEETKLTPKAFWNVPFTNSFYDHVHDVVNISPMFAAQVKEGVEPKLSSEHDEYGWFAYGEAITKLVWPGQREGIRLVSEYIVGGQQASTLMRLI